MARSFDASLFQYLQAATVGITNYPFTIACWAKVLDKDDARNLVFFGNDAAPFPKSQRIVMNATAGVGKARARSTSTSTGFAECSVEYTIGQWHHICGRFASSTSRAVNMDGDPVTQGNNSDNIAFPSPIDRLYIGYSLNNAHPFNGEIAEVAIWNVALSDAQVSQLGADEVSPLLIARENLVHYWPLIDNDEDTVGGLVVSAINSPTFTPHPFPVIVSQSAPAAGSTMDASGILRAAVIP